MLIVSKFHDYYDSVVGSVGVDKTCVYNRKTIELKEEYFLKVIPTIDHHGIFAFPFVIGFCGNLYCGYQLRPAYADNTICTYNKQEVLDFFKEFKKYYRKMWRRDAYFWREKETFDNFFQLHGRENDLFMQKHVPVFVERYDYCNRKFIINPSLKEFEFYKICDTFTAFQEIHMFLSGVLGAPEKPIIEISEKDKVVSKGFDKWSFRNPDPPKRKQKKK